MQLSGRTILITGGASGLGGATVDMVVAQGARAVVIDLNDEAGGAKEAAHGGAVRFVKGDVTVEADVQRAVALAVASSAASTASSTPLACRPPNGCCRKTEFNRCSISSASSA